MIHKFHKKTNRQTNSKELSTQCLLVEIKSKCKSQKYHYLHILPKTWAQNKTEEMVGPLAFCGIGHDTIREYLRSEGIENCVFDFKRFVRLVPLQQPQKA